MEEKEVLVQLAAALGWLVKLYETTMKFEGTILFFSSSNSKSEMEALSLFRPVT